MCREWNEQREKLEAAVIDATMDLFQFMGPAGAFLMPLPSGESAKLIVSAGPAEDVASMAREYEPPQKEGA